MQMKNNVQYTNNNVSILNKLLIFTTPSNLIKNNA